MNKKLFVFLRHNNDVDHIVPVLWKWLQEDNIWVDVILTNRNISIDDFRFVTLRAGSRNITIKHVDSFFRKTSIPNIYLYLYEKYYTPMDKYTDKYEYVYNKVNSAIDRIADKVFDGVDKGVVVFDWVVNHFVKEMIRHANDHGFITVSFPHGDAPYINQLETINQLDYSHLKNYGKLNIFDYVVVPNWVVERRYKDYVDDGKVKVLGSSRYCDEWMKIINSLTKDYVNNKVKGDFKVVIFLRNICYPVFWDELGRTIELLLQFPNVCVVVKPHARGRNDRTIEYKLCNSNPNLKKHMGCRLVFEKLDTSPLSLIHWCDLVLDLGTSMIWEAVKLGKPVFCLDYLHTNISTVSHYIDTCRINTRDELFDGVSGLLDGSNKEFYKPRDKKKFVDEIIDYPDKNVLDGYCSFLKEIC